MTACSSPGRARTLLRCAGSPARIACPLPVAPWKDHLYTLEEENQEVGKVVYVLYPEKPGPDAKWRIQCVPESKDSFQSRKPLPAGWRGFRDEELDKIASIDGCVFVHAAGFIGGNK